MILTAVFPVKSFMRSGEVMKKKDKSFKRLFKMSAEELEQYLHFKNKGSVIANKKGKGSYSRKEKHKKDLLD